MSDPSLKILFCAFQVMPEPSGLGARAAEFLRALQGRCTVDALAVKTPEHGHIERYHGARLMRVPLGAGDLSARAQAFERAVRRQLDSDEYQIVHFTDPLAGRTLCQLKSTHAFKLVYDACHFPSVDLRDTEPHLEGDRRFMANLRQQELACLLAADAVLTGSPVTRSFIAGLGVPGERISVVPPAVDLARFAGAAAARPDRIPMRLLYLGSQAAWQGLPTLLFALRNALEQPEAMGVRLAVLGPTRASARQQLDEQIEASGLAGSVDFLAPVPRDELPGLIAQYDVGVAPLEKCDRNAQQGGLVMKAAEYAAAGRPIIASDLPVLHQLVDERAAIFCAPGNEGALSQAIAALAKDPARRVQMGGAARALAQDRFDAARAGAQLLEIYAQIAATGAAPAGRGEAEETSYDAPTSLAQLSGPEAVTGSTSPTQPRISEVRADETTGSMAAPTATVRLSVEPAPAARAEEPPRLPPVLARAPPILLKRGLEAGSQPGAAPAHPPPLPQRSGVGEVPTPPGEKNDAMAVDARDEDVEELEVEEVDAVEIPPAPAAPGQAVSAFAGMPAVQATTAEVLGGSLALGPTPWLSGLLFGFSPLGQLRGRG